MNNCECDFSPIPVVEGSILKMIVNFSFPADLTLTIDDIDIEVDYFCRPDMVHHFNKSDLIREESTAGVAYYAMVDTLITGCGTMKALMTATIADGDAPGSRRPEKKIVPTGIAVLKNPLL